MEDKTSTKKFQVKPSLRISIPKWRLREHNKKIKVSSPAPQLLRTSSIHLGIQDHEDNTNSVAETSVNEAASLSSERVYVLSSSFEDHDFEKQNDKTVLTKGSSYSQFPVDELCSNLQIKRPHFCNNLNETKAPISSESDTNVKELLGDINSYPSEEFLAMMRLFNGNMELIHNILKDPSFIFAHYLQVKHASNAGLTRTRSFPTSGKTAERKNDGLFRFKNKIFTSEYPIKQAKIVNSDSKKPSSPKAEMADFDEEKTSKLVEKVKASSNILQEHHRISMDGILHKIPYRGIKPEDVNKGSSCCLDTFAEDKLERESLRHTGWNKISKHSKKNIKRSQSLNDSLHRYSSLYESLAREEIKENPERIKLAKQVDPSAGKLTVRALRKIFSLSDIEYRSSKINGTDATQRSSSEDLTTARAGEALRKEGSTVYTSEVSSKCISQCDQKQRDSCQIPEENSKEEFIKCLEHEYVSKPHNYSDVTIEETQNSEINLAKEKPLQDADHYDPLLFQIDQKDQVVFKYMNQILRRSGVCGGNFLGNYNPLDPLIFNEAEGLSYELDFTEDEHDILLEHQLLLFDLINEVLIEICNNYYYYFPWLSHFNTSIRPFPIGNHIMEEIWESICWHLKGQDCIDLDDIVARHFTRHDGWMKNIEHDIEDVELEVESLILDDLLDEFALQLSLD